MLNLSPIYPDLLLKLTPEDLPGEGQPQHLPILVYHLDLFLGVLTYLGYESLGSGYSHFHSLLFSEYQQQDGQNEAKEHRSTIING